MKTFHQIFIIELFELKFQCGRNIKGYIYKRSLFAKKEIIEFY